MTLSMEKTLDRQGNTCVSHIAMTLWYGACHPMSTSCGCVGQMQTQKHAAAIHLHPRQLFDFPLKTTQLYKYETSRVHDYMLHVVIMYLYEPTYMCGIIA